MMGPETRKWLLERVESDLRSAEEELREAKRLANEYRKRCEDPDWNSVSLPGLPKGLGTKSCWWSEVLKWESLAKKDEKKIARLQAVCSELRP